MNMTDLFISDSRTILNDSINGFASVITVSDPVTSSTQISGFFNSYKTEISTNTGLPAIAQIPSVTFDRSVIFDKITEGKLSRLPQKGQKIELTYLGNLLKYVIEEIDEDKSMNMVTYILRVYNG